MGIEEDILQYPNSAWCESSLRDRPIPKDCECRYCKARRKLGWIVCPECEFISDGVVDMRWKWYEHYEDCSMYVDNIHRNSIPFTTIHLSYKGKGPNTIGSFINWINVNPFEVKQ